MVRVHPTVPFEISRKSYLFRAARFTCRHRSGQRRVSSPQKSVWANSIRRVHSNADHSEIVRRPRAKALADLCPLAVRPFNDITAHQLRYRFAHRRAHTPSAVVLGEAFFKGDPPAPTPLCLKGGLADQKLNRTQNAYESDYAIWAPLQEWATTHGVAVLGLHHTREGRRSS